MALQRIAAKDAPPCNELIHLPWADLTQLRAFRDRQPDEALLARVDTVVATPPEFLENPLLTIRALENSLAQMLQNWMGAAAELLDPEMGCALSHAAGVAHGRRVLGTYLSENGLSGGARAMAGWQDTSHAMRGPRHASALFARYSDKYVEIVRTDDSMKSMAADRPAILQAFLDGVIVGYQQADPSLLKVEELLRENAAGETEYVHIYTFA